jgi:hypothetical protein
MFLGGGSGSGIIVVFFIRAVLLAIFATNSANSSTDGGDHVAALKNA